MSSGAPSPQKLKLTERDFNLISQAQDEFNKKKFNYCLETLNKLEESMGNNYKIKHNKAIVEFYRSESKEIEKLLKFLKSSESNEGSGSKTSTIRAIVCYNKAVIYYHNRMFFTALELLTPLVERLDDLEEATVASISLLMISLLLATNQLQKAQTFLDALQIQLGLSLESLISDDNSLNENHENIDDFHRMFKLMAVLTNVLNRKPVAIIDDGTPEFAAVKAHQFYLMKDFQMAAKQLKKFCTGTYTIENYGEDSDTCIANNMGIIHLRVRHYAIAAKFFQNAINFDRKIASNLKNAPLHYLSAPRSREILYNLGIAMLHLKRPKEAFQCFLIPLKSYHGNPRLWFRLAESCIMDHEMNRAENENKPIIASVICPAGRKKYILQPTPKLKYPEDDQSAAIPDTNLEFASLCLRSALYLMNVYKNIFEHNANATDTDTQSWVSVKDKNICNPSMPVSKDSFEKLTAAIYAASSFVSLRLGDFVNALDNANLLLKIDNISDAYRMLAHMYCSEALFKMDKLSEAKQHLDPKFVTSLNAYDFETKDWEVKSLDAAQSIVRYNLIVSMILQGDHESAKSLLPSCNHPIVASKLVSLKAYLKIISK